MREHDGFHELPLNTILQGDSCQILPLLPEKSVDVIFADPPYNLQLHKTLLRPDLSRVDAVTDDWDQFADYTVYDAFTREWLRACRRVLKDSGTIWVIGSYHNIHRVGAALMDLDYWILNEIAWIKTNPMPNFRGTRFTNAHETLIWAQKIRGASYRFNYHEMKALNGGLQMRSDWVLPICTGPERIRIDGEKAHSTQKPEALLYRVIMSSSQQGDVILDPFFGSGTTGAVAKKLHRNWIGIEENPVYVDIAHKRIDSISPSPYSDEVFKPYNPRKAPRVPFRFLVESGVILPGAALYFRKDPSLTVVVLSNGKLRYGDQIGSIHQIAKLLMGGSCNGWMQWLVDDKDGGARIVIDDLRAIIRREIETGTVED